MTDYVDVLSGKSPKLADLCLRVEEEYMSDVSTSKWATYGIHSVFLCKGRMAYQSEILLGAGITDYSTVSLWEGAGAAYLLHFLIYGPEDRFDRKVWKIVNVEPVYDAKIYTPIDFYIKFIWKSSEVLESLLLNADIDSICKVAMRHSKYVTGKVDFSVYPAFAPDLTGISLDRTITECVERVAGFSEKECGKHLPKEEWGVARYCIARAKKLCDKRFVSTISDGRVKIFSGGEHIFDEVILPNEAMTTIPYDVARIRRLAEVVR